MKISEVYSGAYAPLFHGTKVETAIQILQDRMIRSYLKGPVGQKLGKKSISVTRDKRLHGLYGMHGNVDDYFEVYFQINQDKLRRNFVVVPFDDFGGIGRKINKSESEELVITEKGIPLSYVDKIWIDLTGLPNEMYLWAIQHFADQQDIPVSDWKNVYDDPLLSLTFDKEWHKLRTHRFR